MSKYRAEFLVEEIPGCMYRPVGNIYADGRVETSIQADVVCDRELAVRIAKAMRLAYQAGKEVMGKVVKESLK